MLYSVLIWSTIIGAILAFNARTRLGLLIGQLLFFGSFMSLVLTVVLKRDIKLLNQIHSEEYSVLYGER